MSLRSILYFSMIAGTLATLSTFLLVDRESAVILTLGGSAVGMIALIAGALLLRILPQRCGEFYVRDFDVVPQSV